MSEETLWRDYWKNVASCYNNEIANQLNIEPVSLKEFKPISLKKIARELYEACKNHQDKLDTIVSLYTKAKFSQSVLRNVSRIPWGPARAVGNIMRRNPFPFIVPCHRVVRNDGSIGGFMGGFQNSTKVKKKLLEMEGIIVENRRINLKKYGF
ncbi:MAG: methylated-DNA--[protein]-cysteine S-methyltransferase [Candidatus Sifarchaeia archaeon]|jgi:O6-methylguanine-DNA--protein-cysteine methyltransferase